MGFPIWSFWPVRSHELLENSQALRNAIGPSRAQWKDLVAEGTLYLVTEHEDIRIILA